MIKNILVLLVLTITNIGLAQAQKYQVLIDLSAAADDKLPIIITTPEIASDTVEYHMPKIVPGTYSISNFGRFISEFKALDAEGNELPVMKISTNKWQIISDGRLDKITYLADDTWDKMPDYEKSSDNIVFEPGGTNINVEEKVFMLNTFGFIGYIQGEKFVPYEVSITHGAELFGATALEKEIKSDTVDLYRAADYNFLADGPIMYCEPDTITRRIANAEVIVSVFSPNDVLTSKEVMDNIYDLMVAQSQYLGGELPVDRYAYLICLFDKYPLSRASGALEHSYSSMYSLAEANADRIASTIRDVAAHEFLHIVTPLNIHSKEIGEFNYIEPEMSKHLWLYEGVTEYSSMHVQVKHDLYDEDRFLEEIGDKLVTADRFPNVSFTEMSAKILEPTYEPMYSNVYYKGALIGLCLDLYITKYSNGEKNLQWLMKELAKKYGKEVSFDDEELFGVITALTSPEVGEYLDTYVAGDTPLPLTETLGWAGINYQAEKTVQNITMGKFGLGLDDNKELIIDDISNLNAFGKDLGLKVNDRLLEIQGKVFSLNTASQVMEEYKAETEPGDKVIFLVERELRGKKKTKKLKAKAIEIDMVEKHHLEMIASPTEDQAQIKNLWIGE